MNPIKVDTENHEKRTTGLLQIHHLDMKEDDS